MATTGITKTNAAIAAHRTSPESELQRRPTDRMTMKDKGNDYAWYRCYAHVSDQSCLRR